MFKLGGFSIKRRTKDQVDLAATKTTLTSLAESLRNKNPAGEDDPDKVQEKKDEDSEDDESAVS